MRLVLACAAAVVLLSGCGGDEPAAAPAPAPSPVVAVPAVGPPAFVEFLRDTNYGSKDLTSAPDGPLLQLGTTVCDGLGVMPYGSVVRGLTESDGAFTTVEANRIALEAVKNLCPEKQTLVP